MAPSKCAFLKWSVAQKFVGCFNQEFYVQEWVQCYWCILHLHPSSACFMLLCISQFPDFPSEWTRRCVFQILSLCLWSLQSLDTYSFIRYSYPFSFWISIALIFLLLSSCMHVTPWFTVTYFFYSHYSRYWHNVYKKQRKPHKCKPHAKYLYVCLWTRQTYIILLCGERLYYYSKKMRSCQTMSTINYDIT